MALPAHDLATALLRLVSAVEADGGASVRAASAMALAHLHAFDTAELVVTGLSGVQRWPLGSQDTTPLVGGDVLARLATRTEPVRIDDERSGEEWPDTMALMAEAGMASLLVAPFGGLAFRGAVAVGRRYGWAFVGVPLRAFIPLARMIGVSHDVAIRLTAALAGVSQPRDDGRAVLMLEAESLRTALAVAQRDLGKRIEEALDTERDLATEREARRVCEEQLATVREALAAARAEPTTGAAAAQSRRRRR